MTKLTTYILLILNITLLSGCGHKIYKDPLIKKIAHIEKQSVSIIGISALHIEDGKKIEYNQNLHFPMASTVKVPVAIYLMHLAETKQINLDKMVNIEPCDLVLGSGLMGYFLSRPGLSISIYNMFEPMMAISDNSATDIILKQIGGPESVYKYLKNHGIYDIQVSRYIEDIYKDSTGLNSWPKSNTLTLAKRKEILNSVSDEQKIKSYRDFYNDLRDTATPESMTILLSKLYKKEFFNDKYTNMILEVMYKCQLSHFKKILPKDLHIASKTGTWWDNNSTGKKYNYTNEIGIITLPDSKGHIAVSIYIKSDVSDLERQKTAINKIIKLIYRSYLND